MLDNSEKVVNIMALPEDDHKDDEIASYSALSPKDAFEPPKYSCSKICPPTNVDEAAKAVHPGIIDYWALNDKI